MSVIALGTIYEKVANWNSLRYDRVYNHDLAVSLLREELTEYFDANSRVDQLDALCDLVYVAMGILWKIDCSDDVLESNAQESHEQASAFIQTNTLEPIYFVASIIECLDHSADYPVALAAQMVITLCMTQMSMMGMLHHEALLSLLIVCESNDSKSVNKADSSVKANGNDKGPFYKAPEPMLADVLKQVEERHNVN